MDDKESINKAIKNVESEIKHYEEKLVNNLMCDDFMKIPEVMTIPKALDILYELNKWLHEKKKED